MVAMATTVMGGGVTTVTSTPTSPTDTTTSRTRVISTTVSVSSQPSRSTQPSARAFSAYLAPPHARAGGSSAAPHLENQAGPSFRAFEKSDRSRWSRRLPWFLIQAGPRQSQCWRAFQAADASVTVGGPEPYLRQPAAATRDAGPPAISL